MILVAIGSLLMMASPITCVAAQTPDGGVWGFALFFAGLLVFVGGRILQ